MIEFIAISCLATGMRLFTVSSIVSNDLNISCNERLRLHFDFEDVQVLC